MDEPNLPELNLKKVEQMAVVQALKVHRGNRTQAAWALGLSVRTLQRKIKLYRLPAAPPQTCRASQNLPATV